MELVYYLQQTDLRCAQKAASFHPPGKLFSADLSAKCLSRTEMDTAKGQQQIDVAQISFENRRYFPVCS